MRKNYSTFLFLILIGWSIIASADTSMGRYLSVSYKPQSAQVDLLTQMIQVRFPQNVQTVGNAMSYLLQWSGYSLVPEDRQSHALKTTLSKPLPAVDRNFGPMTLKDALTTLAGPAFYLVQDPLNRMVDFRVKPQLAGLYKDPTSHFITRHSIKMHQTRQEGERS